MIKEAGEKLVSVIRETIPLDKPLSMRGLEVFAQARLHGEIVSDEELSSYVAKCGGGIQATYPEAYKASAGVENTGRSRKVTAYHIMLARANWLKAHSAGH